MMTEWKKYTGSDEQIDQLDAATHTGYIVRWKHNGRESEVLTGLESSDVWEHSEFTHYWIIPEDPLREMKIQQARTGQPVWVRVKTRKGSFTTGIFTHTEIYETSPPDWNIPNAEYSFSPFEKEIKFKEEV